MFNKNILNALGLSICIVILLTMTQCAGRTVSDLPKDILGISVGMNKESVERRLREIGKLEREEPKRQQVWSLRNDPSYAYLAVGYDENNLLNYVTAIAKPRDGQAVRYTDVGDLSTAKKEVFEPNHRYIWEVPANGDAPAYLVTVQGTTPEVLSLYTLSKTPDGSQAE